MQNTFFILNHNPELHNMPQIILLLLACVLAPLLEADSRPNILWITVEDMSSHFGYQGEALVDTPVIDQLARDGTTFTQAFVTAPVCSTARSAMINGMYQTTIGAHHHRSGRGEVKIHLPYPVRPLPELFQDAGYFTANNRKTDYNFEWDRTMYDAQDWTDAPTNQPFFAQIHLRGGKWRNHLGILNARVAQELPALIAPDAVTLPPYYPNHPVLLQDWAAYLDTVNYTDIEVGRILDQLKEAGRLDNTVIIFMTDHGVSHVRGKQFLYEEGIKIPFIVKGPAVPAGVINDELIAHIDMAAISLALAGIDIPDWMQARNVLEPGAQREFVISARDRCDETVEQLRSVRTKQFKYIRNGYPDRPHLQPNRYKDDKAIVQAVREWGKAGKLNENQVALVAPVRPVEELYDLASDPWELNNLAAHPAYMEVLKTHRNLLDTWITDTGDQGQLPEGAQYDSDMAVYTGGRHEGQREILERNIALMKQWEAEGK